MQIDKITANLSIGLSVDDRTAHTCAYLLGIWLTQSDKRGLNVLDDGHGNRYVSLTDDISGEVADLIK